MIYMGTDPGRGGASAIYDMENNYLHLIDTKYAVGKEMIPTYKWIEKFYDILQGRKIDHAICEDVVGRNGWGLSQVSVFMKATGGAMMIAQLLSEGNLEVVKPVKWNTYFQLIKATKEESVAKAEEMWANIPHDKFSRHDKAEAALILAYGMSLWNNS